MKNNNAKGQTVLIIDDDELFQKYVGDALMANGYRVLMAGDGEQGIKLAQYHNPDLILMDIMMPKMDGYTACSELKLGADRSGIPIVFVSAHGFELNKELLAATDELRRCFTNMYGIAESLDEKIKRCDEASLKVPLREIIRIARDMEGKLSRCYHACELLVQSCNDKANLSGIAGSPLPHFPDYVRKKFGVELDEDLVTMIEDLIERQRDKMKLAKYGDRG